VCYYRLRLVYYSIRFVNLSYVIIMQTVLVFMLTGNWLYLYGLKELYVCVSCVVAGSSAWEQLFRAVLATHTCFWLALGDSPPPPPPSSSPLPSLLTSLLFSRGRGTLAAPIILMPTLSLPEAQACVCAPAHRQTHTAKYTATESCQEREPKALMPWSALFLFPLPPLSISLSA